MSVMAKLTGAGIGLQLAGDELIVRPHSPFTDEQLAYLQAHKAEIVDALKADRRRRRDEVLMMLADSPAVKYAYAVGDPTTDPVIIAIAIRDLATFEMTIPAERYDPFKLLQIIDNSNGVAA